MIWVQLQWRISSFLLNKMVSYSHALGLSLLGTSVKESFPYQTLYIWFQSPTVGELLVGSYTGLSREALNQLDLELITRPLENNVTQWCQYVKQSVGIICAWTDLSRVEDSIATAWSKFTLTVLLNRSFASSDKCFWNQSLVYSKILQWMLDWYIQWWTEASLWNRKKSATGYRTGWGNIQGGVNVIRHVRGARVIKTWVWLTRIGWSIVRVKGVTVMGCWRHCHW